MNDIFRSILLQLGIAGLKALIPALGSLLGGPLGWLAGFAVTWLSNLLLKWVERLGIIMKNEARAKVISDDVVKATEAWQKVAGNADVTKEDKEKAYEDFKRSHRTIKFGSVQPR